MLVVPMLLEEVISVTPAIRPNCRSSGVATDEAMISGLAPRKPAATEMGGKSTCGRAERGDTLNATAPARARAMVRSAVATGRRMNGVDKLMASPLELTRGRHFPSDLHANQRLFWRGGRSKYKSREWCTA